MIMGNILCEFPSYLSLIFLWKIKIIFWVKKNIFEYLKTILKFQNYFQVSSVIFLYIYI